ncbi:MAG: methyltransferase domain-containing protein [Verrucomicrobia bacterium]|nr:methyltransferase domain-containing protein [Verrucomicrobiota bacterium]
MDKSLLTKIFGFHATLIHGDTFVVDRWSWMKQRLPVTNNGESLLDVGCGTGTFTIGSARRGYKALGLSWDVRNQTVASERAQICGADNASFEILDVRILDTKREYLGRYDFVLCLENVEHIIDDKKLFKDMAACLKPGGRLLLTTPYLLYRSISDYDNGPFCKTEVGWHVRRGYTEKMLEELCDLAGLIAEEYSYCGGLISQKVTAVQRTLSKIHPLFAWLFILPLRIFPVLFDRLITKLTRWPSYSICLQAYKPRYSSDK